MIRTVRVGDAGKLVPLMKDLGYPSTKEQMKKRLTRILSKGDFKTFVWEEYNELLGMIGMTYCEAYHTDDPHVRVIAFVVRESAQGKGIGKQLMQKAENWALQTGAKTIMLNSGNRDDRESAHHIYHQLGFEGRATGFYKKI
ncbi:Acetyltransferase (GNAT) family protein [Halobacillus karajensis]|uniref:Acetyltransferase n=1 Tax=Halobacillus karajensis TaxID=195088 RepID=A0A024P4W3_9BACI|nr:GNAT family N-acetyltransferase [Halobacillus karajensis]CDQ20447.1 putative acetyltransferase [Halobacillus karajensis]CDQ24084.1 putative acetyltransferase [Halobacillus karajensis]CDQ27562.1 putative acetyltransferase [Halobacillus karajensis]SEH91536.1 Acetyltransferase (GNAT) family protein [Halobacillus karajensis]